MRLVDNPRTMVDNDRKTVKLPWFRTLGIWIWTMSGQGESHHFNIQHYRKILNFGDFSLVRTEFVSPFSGTRLLVPIKTTSSKLKKPFTGPYGPGTL